MDRGVALVLDPRRRRVAERLARLGWQVALTQTSGHFFWGMGAE